MLCYVSLAQIGELARRLDKEGFLTQQMTVSVS